MDDSVALTSLQQDALLTAVLVKAAALAAAAPPVSLAAAASSVSSQLALHTPQNPAAQSPTPSFASDPPAIKEGSRVRIEGLQAVPHINGRTGIVFGSFDRLNARWTVDIAADGEAPARRGSFLPANLRLDV